jgi:hypothetical protein
VSRPQTADGVEGLSPDMEGNNNNNNNDNNNNNPWHYSPDGPKPPLIRFHSLS